MQTSPDTPRPSDASTPPTSVNNPASPPLPPQTPGWGASPQPHAPTWPYAPNAVPPYYAPAAYAPIPTEPDAPTPQIGPEHVPWRWYDMIVPALPLIAGVVITLASAIAGSAAATGGEDKPYSTRVLVVNTIASVFVYAFIFLWIWFFSVRKYRVPWSALGVRNAPKLYWALFIVIAPATWVASNLASLPVIYLFYGGHAPDNPQVKGLTGGGAFSWVALALALISASIVAPIVEELLFRGMLYGWLRTRMNRVVVPVLLSGAIFSVAHGIALILASIFVVGVALAVVYEWTKSTIATMALHSAFNTIGVLLVFGELLLKRP